MKNISEIYLRYNIMPNLAEHQLRVAAVARQICDSFSGTLNVPEALSACLLHDMGNILKFNLSLFPQFLEPQGLAYWENVKKQFTEKYGKDEDAATIAIAKEVGVSEKTQSYINAIGFRNAVRTLAEESFEKKICCYADMRVVPTGVASFEERQADGTKRYEKRTDRKFLNPDERDLRYRALKEIERQIFSNVNILPGDVNDVSIASHLAELKNFEVV